MSAGSNNSNRIDPTPVRLSTNVSIDRQTPKTDFGDRVKIGLETATDTVASGAQVAAPFVPGGAILSAAVSSAMQMSDNSSSGQSNGAGVTGQYAYAAGGISAIPGTGGASGGGSMSTTVNGGSLTGVPTGTGSGGGATAVMGTGQNATEQQFAGQMNQYFDQNVRLLRLQTQMQNENQVFNTVSNVLKVRHETVKNTIANVR
jgi:hypothetical protein